MIRRAMIGMIRAYQLLLSPLLGPRCRFYPSCSRYAAEAIAVHGPLVGLYLGVRRLLRCHPWNPGGVDLVPPRGAVHQHVAHTGDTITSDDVSHDGSASVDPASLGEGRHRHGTAPTPTAP